MYIPLCRCDILPKQGLHQAAALVVHDTREGMHGLCRIEGVHSPFLDAVNVQPLSAVLVALQPSNNCSLTVLLLKLQH